MAYPNSNRPEGAMFSFSQPSQASAVQSMQPAQASWSSAMDDVALGCECADPSLQIAMWGQEMNEPVQAASAS
jgi:hypothetical protein